MAAFLFFSNHPKHCQKNILFTLARRICPIVENTEAKMKHLENLELKQISIPRTIN